MKEFSIFLTNMWIICACINFVIFLIEGYNFDKLMICALDLIIAHYEYEDFKRYG